MEKDELKITLEINDFKCEIIAYNDEGTVIKHAKNSFPEMALPSLHKLVDHVLFKSFARLMVDKLEEIKERKESIEEKSKETEFIKESVETFNDILKKGGVKYE